MQDEPLLTITRVIDYELDPEAVGGLDYRVHCQALERWLAAGVSRGQPVSERQLAFAKELRSLAEAIEHANHPFVVTVEAAGKLWSERRAEMNRRGYGLESVP
jgi:hypothetical protein